ncbi:hypothetical protein ACFL7M_08675 [Thermodesulfobacteriota bacterium]
MAAVYGIIINHEGRISIESEPGKGTRVHIYLPATEVRIKESENPGDPQCRGTVLSSKTLFHQYIVGKTKGDVGVMLR